MKKPVHVFIAMMILPLLFDVIPAHSASFKCTSSSAAGKPAAAFANTPALSKIEKMICDDPKASRLDEQVAGLYWLARSLYPERSQTKEDQKEWISQKRDTCGRSDCIVAAYEERYRELIKLIRPRLRPMPQFSTWTMNWPVTKSPPSYCVASGETDPKATASSFTVKLAHNHRSLCGIGSSIVACGHKIHQFGPITGDFRDGIGWIQFNGSFWNEDGHTWTALTAYDGKRLFWRVLRKTECEGYVEEQVLLKRGTDPLSESSLKELRDDCPGQAAILPRLLEYRTARPDPVPSLKRGDVNIYLELEKHYPDIPACVPAGPITLPEILFPAKALMKRIGGTVRVAALFTGKGHFHKQTVISASPPRIFNSTVLALTPCLKANPAAGSQGTGDCQMILRYDFIFHD